MKKIITLLSLMTFTLAGGLFCFEDQLDKKMEDEQNYSHPSGYYFPNTPPDRFWTSTKLNWFFIGHTYYVSFDSNPDSMLKNQINDDLLARLYVRCISTEDNNNEQPPQPHYGRHDPNAPKNFIDNNDGTVTELNSGYTWTRCPLIEGEQHADTSHDCSGTLATFLTDEADDACQTLNEDPAFAGRQWRLPTVHELFSLINTKTPGTLTY